MTRCFLSPNWGVTFLLLCQFVHCKRESVTGEVNDSHWKEVRKQFPSLKLDDDKLYGRRQQCDKLLKSGQRSRDFESISFENDNDDKVSSGKVRFNRKVEYISQSKKKRKCAKKAKKAAKKALKKASQTPVIEGLWNDALLKQMTVKSGPQSNFGPILSEKSTDVVIRNPFESAWWMFSFDEERSNLTFEFTSVLPVTLRLVDMFCFGDSFEVLDHGILIGQSSRDLLSSNCPSGSELMGMTPQKYFDDGRWSRGMIGLEANLLHSIEIRPFDNPHSGGAAAVRFDLDFSGLPVCLGPLNGILIYEEPVERDSVAETCRSVNAVPVSFEGESLSSSALQAVRSCASGKGEFWTLEGLVKASQSSKKWKTGTSKPHRKYPVLCKIN